VDDIRERKFLAVFGEARCQTYFITSVGDGNCGVELLCSKGSIMNQDVAYSIKIRLNCKMRAVRYVPKLSL